jgi:hypothetical protein
MGKATRPTSTGLPVLDFGERSQSWPSCFHITRCGRQRTVIHPLPEPVRLDIARHQPTISEHARSPAIQDSISGSVGVPLNTLTCRGDGMVVARVVPMRAAARRSAVAGAYGRRPAR